MKKILVLYLFIVSLVYLITGTGTLLTRFELSSRTDSVFLQLMFFIPVSLGNFLIVLPQIGYDVFVYSWLNTLQIIFGVIGIIGVYFLTKENRLGIKIWFFLCSIVGLTVLANFFFLIQAYRNTDFALSGSFPQLPFTLISVFWALTYFFSTWYLRSKINNNPNLINY